MGQRGVYTMDIGERIKRRREELGMTQDELARAAGYKSRSSINKIEIDGRGIPQPKIEALAKALKVTPAYLMGWEEEEETPVYYLDPEAAEIANEIYNREDLRILFDTTRNISKEDLQFIVRMVEGLKKDADDDGA